MIPCRAVVGADASVRPKPPLYQKGAVAKGDWGSF